MEEEREGAAAGPSGKRKRTKEENRRMLWEQRFEKDTKRLLQKEKEDTDRRIRKLRQELALKEIAIEEERRALKERLSKQMWGL